MAVDRTGTISTYAETFTTKVRQGFISMNVVPEVDGAAVSVKTVTMTPQEAVEFMTSHQDVFSQMADAIDNWLVNHGHAQR